MEFLDQLAKQVKPVWMVLLAQLDLLELQDQLEHQEKMV